MTIATLHPGAQAALLAFASSGKPLLSSPIPYSERYCLKSLGAFGSCVSPKGHSSALCRDAMGQTFLGTKQTTIAEYRMFKAAQHEVWMHCQRGLDDLVGDKDRTIERISTLVKTLYPNLGFGTAFVRYTKDAALEGLSPEEAWQLLLGNVVPCDLGHSGCEDAMHSEAYHSCDCRCGATEATCVEG